MSTYRAARGIGLVVAFAVVGSPAAPLALAAPERAVPVTSAAKPDDFNGDGYRDTAVAAPAGTVHGKAKAGYVAVLYGSRAQPLPAVKRMHHQDKPGMPGTAEAGDLYGASLASADLDRDGHADLVIGSPGEERAGVGPGAGSLVVLWGGENGLAGAATLLNGAESYDEIGGHVVTGDFDGDGDADVATSEGRSRLRVLSGPFGRDGSAAAGPVDTDGDFRIMDLAAGDVNGDGRTDIAAAVNDFDEFDARAVRVWAGTRSGPGESASVDGPSGYALEGGENLDIGDVNRDGFEDIVTGRPTDGYDSDVEIPLAKGGMITYIPGSAKGPVGVKARSFNQDSPGIPGTAEGADGRGGSDHFGEGVSIGDIDGDGYPDIAVGVVDEDHSGVKRAGAVVTLRGTREGPTGAGAKFFSQSTAGVPGTAEEGDRFGAATELVDTDGDGRAELLTSATGENESAGAVTAFRSTAAGVTAKNSVTFGNGTLGAVAAPGSLLGHTFLY
ncbi:FG-GAP-like repeat-containing protein [Streptomyces jumonjinensis]|uniref:FG-GAP-like repeat-containing protein n=1 Tax=Streptomyces jumonjinensis TaxID=1945 RepID=UPI0037A2E7C3